MANIIIQNGGGGGRGFNPPTKGTGTKTSSFGGSPGLITSTGGLQAISGLLLTPIVNPLINRNYIILHDSTNFDCEEDAEYDFRQEVPPEQQPQEGRDVTCNKIILKYRELGIATFTIGVTVFVGPPEDNFKTKLIDVKISPIKGRKTFPDKRIHTLEKTFLVTGERPQVTITRKANSGPLAITKLILCGEADEIPDI